MLREAWRKRNYTNIGAEKGEKEIIVNPLI
jgi:hypothetical protein